jgi:hypothetical protein
MQIETNVRCWAPFGPRAMSASHFKYPASDWNVLRFGPVLRDQRVIDRDFFQEVRKYRLLRGH